MSGDRGTRRCIPIGMERGWNCRRRILSRGGCLRQRIERHPDPGPHRLDWGFSFAGRPSPVAGKVNPRLRKIRDALGQVSPLQGFRNLVGVAVPGLAPPGY